MRTQPVRDLDLPALADVLRRRGHVRGNPVAVSLFYDEIPPAYEGKRVEPCAIVSRAMDHGERVFVDAEHHACLAGAWQAGFLEPPAQISSGSYLADNMPFFTTIAARRVKSGENVLPQGTVRAIGAAPLDDVPDGVDVDWIVVVCEPVMAASIGGVRTAVDGTPPRGAAGTSLCGELFAVPWHDRNVIITPGDMGGRMFNHVKPSELFVIVPLEYAAHLVPLLGATPDVGAVMDAIKPGYLDDRDARRRARSQRVGAAAPSGPVWDAEALDLLAKAPAEIREFAGPVMEEYAQEHGHTRITLAVMGEQMAEVGMSLEDVLAMVDE